MSSTITARPPAGEPAPEVVADFLLKLASDDEFRRRLETRTPETLRAAGLDPVSDDLPRVTLPPKEDVERALRTASDDGVLPDVASACPFWYFA